MLVERAPSLAALTAELAGVRAAGRGRLVFLGGEAGVGKTTLLTAFTEQCTDGLPVRRGSCDNVTTAPALGPVLEALPALGEKLTDEEPIDSLRLFRLVRHELAAEPCVLILEDVHWADKATFDVVRVIARRLDSVPALIIATFRADEVGADHPLTTLLGDVATQPGVVRMQLAPLTLHGVRELVAHAGRTLDAEELHRRTGGNPFFVTEVLAGAADEVPASVRDAVLARAARLSPPARRVLDAAAVLGLPSDLALLGQVSGESATGVDECVRRGVLVTDQPGRVAFRHELARLAIEQSLAPGDRALLHERALAALNRREPPDDRRLAYHAAGCGDRAAVLRHAVPAAARAARLRAHREAAQLYQLAVDQGEPPADQRAELYAALSYECYLTDQIPAAYAARRDAMALAEEAGLPRSVGDAQRWLSRLSWFLGRREESAQWGERAVQTLEPLGESAELAMAYSNAAQLLMLAHDPGALDVGERALQLARRVEAAEAEIHALNNVGTALLIAGETDEGLLRLNESLQLALAAEAQEHAARAYTNLASSAVLDRRYPAAHQLLHQGIDYCADRDLGSWRLYMSGWLARLHAERGHYDDADRIAHEVLRHPHVSPITRIGVGVVLAQIAARRGRADDRSLAEERALAEMTGETQRLVPVAAATAERAWLDGDFDAIPAAVDLAWPAVLDHPTPWEVGELAWWLALAGVRRELPGPIRRPFELMLAELWPAAAAEWEAIGAPLWQAICLARSPDLEHGRRALDIADGLRAPAARAALLRDRHAAGAPVPRGPRAPTRTNAWGLTTREVEVLGLLTAGLSNADLAARLYLSEKTVGHHVSSILRKMGEPSRSRAVAAARERGIGAPK